MQEIELNSYINQELRSKQRQKSPKRNSDSKYQMLLEVLGQNNLSLKNLPDGATSLLNAISDSLFYSANYSKDIQQKCFEKLKELINQQKAVNSRLSDLYNNTTLYKDYKTNPALPGFDMLTLELVSLIYDVKVTLYTCRDDGYLSSVIINNKSKRQIDIMRIKNCHFESVYTQNQLQIVNQCQSVIFDILNKITESTMFSEHQTNGQQNENLTDSTNIFEQGSSQEIQLLRPKHNKSLSDSFAPKRLDPMKQQRCYGLFNKQNIPPSIIEKFTTPRRKETSGINLDMNWLIDDDGITTTQNSIDYQYLEFLPEQIPQLSYSNSNPLQQENTLINQYQQLYYYDQYQINNNNSNNSVQIEQKNNKKEENNGTQAKNNKQKKISNNNNNDKKKHVVLDERKIRYSGYLKFFDEQKNYGFIVMDETGCDIFVHYDDLQKVGITKELLRTAKFGNFISLSFACMNYIGKYNQSRKAVDLQLINNNTYSTHNYPQSVLHSNTHQVRVIL